MGVREGAREGLWAWGRGVERGWGRESGGLIRCEGR